MNRRDRRRKAAAGSGGAPRQALERAVQAHQAGRLAEAEAAYRRILVAQPDEPDALHLLGLLAHQGGQPAAAIELIGRAIEINAKMPRFHNNLGLAHAAERRFDAAEASYRRALALDPDYVEAWHNLATVLAESGRSDDAAGCFARALGHNPNYAPAHNNLANLRREAGDNRAAAEGYRRALAVAPDYADAHYNLSVALTALGELDAAEASCRAALALQPDRAEAHNNLGTILKFLGRLEAAKAAYRRALEHKSDLVAARDNLAEFEGADADTIDVLTALEADDSLPAGDAIRVRFGLARHHADAGDHARAFQYYRNGNEMRAREAGRHGRVFDRAAFDALADRSIALFTPEFFAARGAQGAPSGRPVFIVGMPRSGTTLVEQILASHRAVFGAGELDAIEAMTHQLSSVGRAAAAYPDTVAGLDAAARRRLGGAYLERLAMLDANAARVTDKMPANFRHLGLIALLLPGARIVHCRRNPLDVCLSCYVQNFTQGNEFSDDLGDIAVYYRAYRRLIDHWRRVLPVPMLDVRYEELVADQAAVSRRIVDFVGLEWDPACLEFHANRRAVRTSSALQVRRPIYRDSIERWRAYEDELRPLIEALGDAGLSED